MLFIISIILFHFISPLYSSANSLLPEKELSTPKKSSSLKFCTPGNETPKNSLEHKNSFQLNYLFQTPGNKQSPAHVEKKFKYSTSFRLLNFEEKNDTIVKNNFLKKTNSTYYEAVIEKLLDELKSITYEITNCKCDYDLCTCGKYSQPSGEKGLEILRKFTRKAKEIIHEHHFPGSKSFFRKFFLRLLLKTNYSLPFSIISLLTDSIKSNNKLGGLSFPSSFARIKISKPMKNSIHDERNMNLLSLTQEYQKILKEFFKKKNSSLKIPRSFFPINWPFNLLVFLYVQMIKKSLSFTTKKTTLERLKRMIIKALQSTERNNFGRAEIDVLLTFFKENYFQSNINMYIENEIKKSFYPDSFLYLLLIIYYRKNLENEELKKQSLLKFISPTVKYKELTEDYHFSNKCLKNDFFNNIFLIQKEYDELKSYNTFLENMKKELSTIKTFLESNIIEKRTIARTLRSLSFNIHDYDKSYQTIKSIKEVFKSASGNKIINSIFDIIKDFRLIENRLLEEVKKIINKKTSCKFFVDRNFLYDYIENSKDENILYKELQTITSMIIILESILHEIEYFHYDWFSELKKTYLKLEVEDDITKFAGKKTYNKNHYIFKPKYNKLHINIKTANKIEPKKVPYYKKFFERITNIIENKRKGIHSGLTKNKIKSFSENLKKNPRMQSLFIFLKQTHSFIHLLTGSYFKFSIKKLELWNIIKYLKGSRDRIRIPWNCIKNKEKSLTYLLRNLKYKNFETFNLERLKASELTEILKITEAPLFSSNNTTELELIFEKLFDALIKAYHYQDRAPYVGIRFSNKSLPLILLKGRNDIFHIIKKYKESEGLQLTITEKQSLLRPINTLIEFRKGRTKILSQSYLKTIHNFFVGVEIPTSIQEIIADMVNHDLINFTDNSFLTKCVEETFVDYVGQLDDLFPRPPLKALR